MAEVLVEFSDRISDEDGITYVARAIGAENARGQWQGWIEFVPDAGGGAVRSGRETTQPNRTDALYWATGLTPVYLEGALSRALKRLVRLSPQPVPPPAYDEPAPDLVRPPAQDSILNPFSVYRKGEALLRQQLGAFSAWHLVNIIRAHHLSALRADELNAMGDPQLVELIVAGVRNRTKEAILR